MMVTETRQLNDQHMKMRHIHGKNQSNNTLCFNQNMIYSGGIWKHVARAKCNKNRAIMWKHNICQMSKLLFANSIKTHKNIIHYFPFAVRMQNTYN